MIGVWGLRAMGARHDIIGETYRGVRMRTRKGNSSFGGPQCGSKLERTANMERAQHTGRSWPDTLASGGPSECIKTAVKGQVWWLTP
jgi:hypothetical protein